MPPASGPFVAEENGVLVDLLEDLDVALGLDFQDGAALRAKAADLLAVVGDGDVFRSFPVG